MKYLAHHTIAHSLEMNSRAFLIVGVIILTAVARIGLQIWRDRHEG